MTTNLTEANETSINNGKNAKSFFCKLNKLVKKYQGIWNNNMCNCRYTGNILLEPVM